MCILSQEGGQSSCRSLLSLDLLILDHFELAPPSSLCYEMMASVLAGRRVESSALHLAAPARHKLLLRTPSTFSMAPFGPPRSCSRPSSRCPPSPSGPGRCPCARSSSAASGRPWRNMPRSCSGSSGGRSLPPRGSSRSLRRPLAGPRHAVLCCSLAPVVYDFSQYPLINKWKVPHYPIRCCSPFPPPNPATPATPTSSSRHLRKTSFN